MSTATAVKPGFFTNWRKANFKSDMGSYEFEVMSYELETERRSAFMAC